MSSRRCYEVKATFTPASTSEKTTLYASVATNETDLFELALIGAYAFHLKHERRPSDIEAIREQLLASRVDDQVKDGSIQLLKFSVENDGGFIIFTVEQKDV